MQDDKDILKKVSIAFLIIGTLIFALAFLRKNGVLGFIGALMLIIGLGVAVYRNRNL